MESRKFGLGGLQVPVPGSGTMHRSQWRGLVG
jgi:hypothetical protein